MANVIFMPTKVGMPNDDSNRVLLLAIEIEIGNEQMLGLYRGCYSGGMFYVDDNWTQYDLNHGHARVIGWGDLAECYKEARELQSL